MSHAASPDEAPAIIEQYPGFTVALARFDPFATL
jgi:hypothetical protein